MKVVESYKRARLLDLATSDDDKVSLAAVFGDEAAAVASGAATSGRGVCGGGDEDDGVGSLTLPPGWADPTPENVVALALTAALGAAVLWICWRMVIVAVAVAVEALKYAVIAAILAVAVVLLI
eukprot:SM000117S25516  [mRNA]  locus=s117:221904:222818:- [translate_table: standard]